MSKTKKIEEVKSDEVVAVTTNVEKTRETFTYQVPETKEDFLALHKCLQDTGVNSIGDLEVKASKL